jgi:alpha-mannosidase
VFGYILNNYWHTNYKAKQGGRLVFRYSLTSHKGTFSKSRAVADGWNLYCPPVAGRGHTDAKSVLSASARSLLTVEPAGLPLTTIKVAEDQNGFVFRCCDYAGTGGTARLTLPQPANAAFSCNLVEDEMRPLNEHGTKIKAPIKPFGMLTLEARFGAKQ